MTVRLANVLRNFLGTLAVIFMLLTFAGSASAIEPAAYKANIDKARTHVAELLALTAETENGERNRAVEKASADALRAALPESVTVEWNGLSIETSSRTIHARLAAFEADADSTKRAIYLTEIDELLYALSMQLGAAGTQDHFTKDEYKRKLAEILAREEYQKPVEKEGSGIAGLIERFLNWIRSFFPESGPSAPMPFDFSSVAQVLQVLLFAIILGLLGFLIYKFGPLLFPAARRGSRVKKSHRTILGERIAADESASDLFGEAERLAREGEIRAAIRKGYIALLCDLSDKNVIALEQHKTNRDYLRDVRTRQPLYGNMRGLTSSYERHWYGFQPTAAVDWEAFRESYKKAVADV